jgi:hypothetical protein
MILDGNLSAGRNSYTRSHQTRPVSTEAHEGHTDSPEDPVSLDLRLMIQGRTYIMIGMNTEGRSRFNKIFVRGSKVE